MVRCRILASLILLLTGLAASGHDLWLIPPEKPKVKSAETILAHSGMDFPLSEHAPDPAKFKRLLLVLPDGTEGKFASTGTRENSGLLGFESLQEGVHLVAVETTPKLITLEADKFNDYLVSDGLPHIYQLRHREGSLGQPGKERYSKSPKTIFQIGKEEKGDPCRILGLPLEIVPLQNPFRLKIGETLRVKVLFQKEPLAGANLGWDHPGDGEPPSGTVRTDSKGEALIPFAKMGLMTIRLTHMTRPKAEEYEWESFWTTLTFRFPE